MSALVPSNAICLLYRRYLKAANRITNVTIRMLLLQQVRQSFRRHRTISTAAAQRELILQAHKDLNILEDERLNKTVYINRLGMVSCLDWEHTRNEFYVDEKASPIILFFGLLGIAAVFSFPFLVRDIESVDPSATEMVDIMAKRLMADSPEEYKKLEESRMRGMLETSRRQRDLTMRILMTFDDVPGRPPGMQQPLKI